MDWFVRWFVKSGMAWLGGGVTLGVAMAAHPAWIIYRPAHMHMGLLGFVTMMIFGVGYHVLPRFAGSPLHWRRLPGVHWWIANAGLALMVTGFMLRPSLSQPGQIALVAGGALSATGAFCFIVNIWRTLDDASARAKAAESMKDRGLPVTRANA